MAKDHKNSDFDTNFAENHSTNTNNSNINETTDKTDNRSKELCQKLENILNL